MSAEIIAVGSELLRFGRPDTNGDWLLRRLGELGLEVLTRQIVEDDEQRIASALRAARSRAAVVVVTGGLGPTEDDRTREALARALDRPLETDPDQLRKLEERWARLGRTMLPEQARQSLRPRGTACIDNPLGSAPGILVDEGRSLLVALPGVPAEMRSMFDDGVVARLAGRGSSQLYRRVLKIAGRTESDVDRQVRDLYDTPGLVATILSGTGGIELLLRAAGSEGSVLLDRLERQVRDRLSCDVFGRDGETLVGAVGELLQRSGRSVATAESCTGGLLGAALTALAGSSAWYRGGIVAYHDDVKQALAGVSGDILRDHGAVSEPVARALAHAARERCGADIGIGVTGIAGPGGASALKPVGLVHLAIEDPCDCQHWALSLRGDRQQVREQAVTIALDRLRRRLGSAA